MKRITDFFADFSAKHKGGLQSAAAVVLMLGVLVISAGAGGWSGVPPALETAAGAPVLTEPTNQYEGIIRLHIIANSDSQEDQELKLKVRNHVLAKVQNHLADCFGKELVRSGREQLDSRMRADITRNYIETHLEEITGWAEDVLKAEGAVYPVQANLGVTWIPEKEYDGIHFPAGNYEALNITIGEGAGQNWWCVIFPPLCLIDCGEEIYEDRLAAAYGDRIVLKSRILEILESRSPENGKKK